MRFLAEYGSAASLRMLAVGGLRRPMEAVPPPLLLKLLLAPRKAEAVAAAVADVADRLLLLLLPAVPVGLRGASPGCCPCSCTCCC
jgi:hypothetical protein